MFAFLMASLLVPNDLAAWQIFIGLALAHDENLVVAGMACAYLANGESFSRFYMKNLKTPDALKAAEQMFAELANLLRRESAKTIRISRPQGGYDVALERSE